ncbi:ABC transporter permease subunit [Eubacteriales bacterium OttesenSCG-928-M02]|nr:ABC transporter permease subunit [Eubacteriales bacterium OttesenSCG-928-M02]
MASNRATIYLKKLAKWAVITAIWVAVWQLLSIFAGHEVLLPSPFTTFRRLLQLLGELPFYYAIGATFLRVFAGFFLGALFGALLAAICYWLSWAQALFAPLLAVCRSTPFASFIILALLWIRVDYVPVFTATIMSLPIFYEGVWEGMETVDDGMLHMARLYNFKRRDILLFIYLPSIRPYFMAAMASSLGLSFKTGVAAEVISSPKYAIGGLLSNAKVYLETTDLFAVTAALIILSVLMERLLRRLVG